MGYLYISTFFKLLEPLINNKLVYLITPFLIKIARVKLEMKEFSNKGYLLVNYSRKDNDIEELIR